MPMTPTECERRRETLQDAFEGIDKTETFIAVRLTFLLSFDKRRAKAFATHQPFPFAPAFSAQRPETFSNFYSFDCCSLQPSHQYSWEAKRETMIKDDEICVYK